MAFRNHNQQPQQSFLMMNGYTSANSNNLNGGGGQQRTRTESGDKENSGGMASRNSNYNRSGRTESAMSMNSTSISRAQHRQQPFKRPPLPIDRYRKQLRDILESLTDTAIFIGEPACGKSTQIPQFCLEFPWARDGLIAITEPRRVAARTLAMRVAHELNSELEKGLVGYKFRFENKTSAQNRLVYMTEGILVRELLHNCHLKEYAAVIVDEVHERTLNTDILLYVLRQAQRQRAEAGLGPLRIILMSATLDARQLAEYFGGTTVYYLEGRKHRVEVHHAPALRLDDNDYLFNALSTVLELHESEPLSHGFLVFLTGQEEIDTAIDALRRARNPDISADAAALDTLVTIPLYAAVPTAVQSRAFELPPAGKRKVVFATNIAETSVTIPGIAVVIDSGKVKRRSFTPRNRMDVLRVENIAKAQAIQRAGRAGREGPGKCFRLYSTQDYMRMEPEPMPDLQRCSVASVLLGLVDMGLSKLSSLQNLLSPPDADQQRAALHELLALRAIRADEAAGRLEITEEGRRLLAFPIEPAHAKILLAASELGCLEEACIVVAFLSADPVFQFAGHDLFCLTARHSYGQQPDGEQGGSAGSGAQIKFRTNEGDHVRLLNIYRSATSFKRVTDKLREFCNSNGLNQKRLEQVWEIRRQLQDECKKQKLHLNTANNNMELLKRAICRGLFMNACCWDNAAQCYVMERDRQVRVRIHPSSTMYNQRLTAFVYTELVQTNEVYARDICPVKPEWLQEMSSAEKGEQDGNNQSVAEQVQRIMQQTAGGGGGTPVGATGPTPADGRKRRRMVKRKMRRKMKKEMKEEEGKEDGTKRKAPLPPKPKLVNYSPSESSEDEEEEEEVEEMEEDEDEGEEKMEVKKEEDEEEKTRRKK